MTAISVSTVGYPLGLGGRQKSEGVSTTKDFQSAHRHGEAAGRPRYRWSAYQVTVVPACLPTGVISVLVLISTQELTLRVPRDSILYLCGRRSCRRNAQIRTPSVGSDAASLISFVCDGRMYARNTSTSPVVTGNQLNHSAPTWNVTAPVALTKNSWIFVKGGNTMNWAGILLTTYRVGGNIYTDFQRRRQCFSAYEAGLSIAPFISTGHTVTDSSKRRTGALIAAPPLNTCQTSRHPTESKNTTNLR